MQYLLSFVLDNDAEQNPSNSWLVLVSSESLTFVKHKSSVFSLASDEHVLFSISNPFSNSYLHAVLPNFSMLTKQKRYAQYIVHVMENHHKLRLVQLSLFSCHLFLLQEHTLKLCNT